MSIAVAMEINMVLILTRSRHLVIGVKAVELGDS